MKKFKLPTFKEAWQYIWGPHNYEQQYNPRRQAKYEEIGGGYARVLVWELPVRIWHWVTVIACYILMYTGIYIGKPFTAASLGGNADAYLMGWMRIVHFIAAFVFMAGLIVRAYWTFVGNRYVTFDIYKAGFIRGLFESVKFYLFFPNKKPHTLGHNALAQFSYWVLFAGSALVLSFTGMYMFLEPQTGTIAHTLFGWVPIVFGGSFMNRSLHHWAAWMMMIFSVAHIYLAFREEYLVRNGTISSIFSGWKIDKLKLVTGESDDKKIA